MLIHRLFKGARNKLSSLVLGVLLCDVDIRLITFDLHFHFAVVFILCYRHCEFISDEFPSYVMLYVYIILGTDRIFHISTVKLIILHLLCIVENVDRHSLQCSVSNAIKLLQGPYKLP